MFSTVIFFFAKQSHTALLHRFQQATAEGFRWIVDVQPAMQLLNGFHPVPCESWYSSVLGKPSKPNTRKFLLSHTLGEPHSPSRVEWASDANPAHPVHMCGENPPTQILPVA